LNIKGDTISHMAAVIRGH